MVPSAVATDVLDLAYERYGPPGGPSVVLLHGFPYAPAGYAEVAGRLAERGVDVVVPYLRGYGPTRFRSPATPRSGQQAALGHDLRELLSALGLDRPVVAGYDWGGRAACVVAALWPASVGGLVTVGGYNIQDIAGAATPRAPEEERRYWYQFYLHGERGRAGLDANRAEFARLLWSEWSPEWSFSADEFEESAAAFGNPDFVEVVVHSYRHRYGLVPGDPAYAATEDALAARPRIDVATIVLEGTSDTVTPVRGRAEQEGSFGALLDHRLVAAGHNVPQEVPAEFAQAVLDVLANPVDHPT